jgi:hypothetical protein
MSARTSLFFDAEAVREAVRNATTQADAIRALGQVAHADNYRRLREACVRYGLEVPRRNLRSDDESTPARQARVLKITAERIAAVLPGASSRLEVIRRLGAAPSSSSYRRLAMVATEAGLELPARGLNGKRENPYVRLAMENARALPDATIRQQAEESRSQAELMSAWGLPARTDTYRFMRSLLSERGIDVPPLHYRLGQLGMPNSEFFALGVRRKTSEAKARIRRDNLIPHNLCSECGIPAEWNGKPLAFHLDHINGDTADNRLTNLRFLCPNCHSQTDTYCKPKQYRLAA